MTSPMTLTIGTQVWYHSRSLTPFERPRVAFITEPGSLPNTVNLLVASAMIADVSDAKMPPVFLRRNVPVFQAYPQQWPMEDFAVLPGTAAPLLGGAGEAPENGRKPSVAAGVLTIVEPYAKSGAATDGDQTEVPVDDPKPIAPVRSVKPAERAPAPKPTPKASKPAKAPQKPATPAKGAKKPKAPPAKAPAKPTPTTKPAPKPTPKAAPKPAPNAPAAPLENPEGARHLRSMDAQMQKLTQHPAFGRAFDDNPCALDGQGDTIRVNSTAGIELARISHSREGESKGFFLAARGWKRKGQILGGAIVEGCTTAAALTRLLSLAGEIGRRGAGAKTTAEADKLLPGSVEAVREADQGDE